MLPLLQAFGIYFGFALAVMYGIWRLIGHQGFIGLEDTNSRLAKHFRKTPEEIRDPRHIASARDRSATSAPEA
jgi:hypothetical protein